MADIINELPDDSTYDEILRELAFRRMIERGLKNSNEEKIISNNEMEKRIKLWQPKRRVEECSLSPKVNNVPDTSKKEI